MQNLLGNSNLLNNKEMSETSKIFTFLIKAYLGLYVFISVNFFSFWIKLQLLSKFEVKKMSESSKVLILGRGHIMFSQNVLFHAQVTKFFTSLKSHVSPLRLIETCCFISQYFMKLEIWNVIMSISTERRSFLYMYI